MTIEAAVLAALISGVVSLTIVLLNARSLRESRSDEHRRRRQDWFLEKQARDAEEIIATLDDFLRTVDENVTTSQRTVFGAITSRNAIDDSGMFKETYGRVAQELSSRLSETDSMHQAWFKYSSVRLLVWFSVSTRQSLDLEPLAMSFFKVQKNLFDAAFELYITAQEELDLEDCTLRLHHIEKTITEAEADWKRLVERTADTQRSLVRAMTID